MSQRTRMRLKPTLIALAAAAMFPRDRPGLAAACSQQ